MKRWTGLFAAGALTTATAAQAVTITEYFNNYGEATTNLSGLGAAEGGWSTAWTDSTPDYHAGKQLTYNAPGYSNAGNESGSDDGAAGFDSGDSGNAGSITKRGLPYPGLGGTIWVSALAQVNDAAGEAILWLGGSAANNYIGIRAGHIKARYLSGDTILTTAGEVKVGETYLFLAKIEVGAGADPDTISLWYNPDLSNGEQGLGDPAFVGKDSHAFGIDATAEPHVSLDMSGIRVSFAKAGSYIDAIRISNDADGFAKVTSVPEPASALGLMGLGGLALMRWNRR